MTNDEFSRWLKDSSTIRCILVEVDIVVGGVPTTRYLSNRGYVTGNGDIPANTIYSALIVGGVKFTESISTTGEPSLSFGDIELDNTDGRLDSWINDDWRGKALRIFVGDVTWERSKFRQILSGTVDSIGTRSRHRFNIKITDKLVAFNSALTGTVGSEGKVSPLCYGECHNIEPMVVDAATLVYQVHEGPIEHIIEVRDNGIPVGFTANLAAGQFTLSKQPFGQVTCSVQGDSNGGYSNTVAGLLQKIGGITLDSQSHTEFPKLNTVPVGVCITDRSNIIDVCSKLVASIGLRLMVRRNGQIGVTKLDPNKAGSSTVVTSTDMLDKSLSVTLSEEPIQTANVGYCKNYTVQTSLAQGVPANHATMFGQEWFRTGGEEEMIETFLLTHTDAQALATELKSLAGVQRKVISYTGMPHLLLAELGSKQTIIHERFGLSNGATGQVISLSTDWISGKVDVEVLV